jgi:hypothetical protein
VRRQKAPNSRLLAVVVDRQRSKGAAVVAALRDLPIPTAAVSGVRTMAAKRGDS